MPINNSSYDTRDGVPDPLPTHCGWCEQPFTDAVDEELHHVRSSSLRTLRTIICTDCEMSSATCSFCNRVRSGEDMRSEHIDGEAHTEICDSCLEDFHWCDYCDTMRDDDHDFEHYDDNMDDCEDDAGVHGYSYKPNPIFHVRNAGRNAILYTPANQSDIFTGIELEVEAGDAPYVELAHTAQEVFGDVAYLKHDGSLNHGFEIVTHPMSLEYARDGIRWDAVRSLAQMGARSAQTSTCGLHIHVNRSWMVKNPTLQYRFMALFYNNVDKWQKLAGRSNSSYAVWDESERQSMLRYARALKNGIGDWNGVNHSRYVALNLQGGSTIELRFFKGTLKPSTLLARIEAVHAVSNFVRESQYRLPASSVHEWERFRNWTVINKYNAFDAYATEKGV